MEDVFDLNEEDKEAELKLGSREWLRRATEVSIAGEREGLYASREALLQSEFNFGVEQGFKLSNLLSVIKGRLQIKCHLDPQNHAYLKDLIQSHKQLEDDAVAQFALPTFSCTHLEELERRTAELIKKSRTLC